MDSEILIMLKLNGTWNSALTFTHTDTCFVHVHYLATYSSFIQMFTPVILQYKPDHHFKLSYLVESCPPPVIVNDELTFRFYLQLKCVQPASHKYPLCVEFFPRPAFTIQPIQLPKPSEQSHFSANTPSIQNLSHGMQFYKDSEFDLGDAQHTVSGTSNPISCTSDIDMIETMNNASTSDLEDSDSLSDSPLPLSPQPQYNFHNVEIITHHHPTCIVLHAIYLNKRELKYHLQMYAITNGFQYRTLTSRKICLHVICVAKNCKWSVRAVKLDGVEMFQIRRFDPVHVCSIDFRQGKHRQATSSVIAKLVAHKFLDASTVPYKPKQIRADMSMEYGISMSYKKSWKARKQAMEMQFGSDADSYQMLPSIGYMLDKTNPESKITLTIGDGDVFEYFFISLSPWINAWRHCRPVLIVDGSFLKAYYKGTLLTACAQDANNQIVPIAFAICDSESKASWHWFLSKVSACIQYRDDMYIISDRHKGILSAARKVFPHASHGFCVEHLRRNMISKFRGSSKDLGWKFRAAYMASTVKEYEQYLSLLDAEDVRMRAWLEKIGGQKWAKCLAGPSRFNVMTSNCAESLNSVNVCAREYCVSKLIDFLRERMQEWFTERREKAESTHTILSEKNEKVLVALQLESRCMKVKPSCAYEFEVIDRKCRCFVVNLNSKSCSCGQFQLDHFVCVHAVAAIGSRPGLSCYNYISPYYTRDMLLATWSGIMHPIGDSEDWVIPSHISSVRCKPPSCLKRPPGRPKKSRIPSIGEYRGSKHRKCSRCNVVGHNKKTCS
ncbi:unnamed protein product, partial [Cuscuta epithymum]